MGIVTQKFKTRIDTILERDGLEGIFDVIVGADTATELKPHPGGLLSAVSQLGSEPAQALYVGDSATDAETARRACVPFLPVLTGVTPRKVFGRIRRAQPGGQRGRAAQAGGCVEGRRMIDPNTPDILKAIVEAKREEVERLKVEVPIASLEERIDGQDRPLNFGGALMGTSVRVIAEVKRASPTRGVLRADFDPAWLAKTYAAGGAAAVSVLTNAEHFQGRIEDMEAAHQAVRGTGVPVLRKEFIFDPYQVYEARAYGADAILLIVAMLTPDSLAELFALSQRFWMQCLVEVHDERELAVALDCGRGDYRHQQPRPAHVRDGPGDDRTGRPARAAGEDRRQRERHRQPGRRAARGRGGCARGADRRVAG